MTAVSGATCGVPGGVAAGIYTAAIDNDAARIAALEPKLLCDEDPQLLAYPTGPSIKACMTGLWTTRSERLIDIARRTPRVAAIGAETFPARIGTKSCVLPVVRRAKLLEAACGVMVKEIGSTSIVTFVACWDSRGLDPTWGPYRRDGPPSPLIDLYCYDVTKRHNWRVVVTSDRVAAVAESGAVAPRLSR
jgi:hypothetical protein